MCIVSTIRVKFNDGWSKRRVPIVMNAHIIRADAHPEAANSPGARLVVIPASA
jgi:hypothetical protein